ncbi:MAG: arsenic resistance N-acetyltransferase ArsN2 [candidate division WOR-3 bacterium]|nr:arsenic resistance N-acetyltransferase ArsN2 [candidate division WOR-3 bacterium]
MNDVQIRRAVVDDEARIRELLRESQLPFEDVGKHLGNFLVAEHNNAVVGAVGLEVYGEIALLRSLAVKTSHKNKGIGRKLYDGIIAHARLKGLNRFYLLTTTADQLFRKLGFSDVDRNKLPDEIRMTEEFSKLCPETAVCMAKDIEKDIYYVPKSMQDLAERIPGANMLAVSLEKAMLTYFEVAPGTRFERHQHESEQITFVIEGELFFEIDDRVVSLGPGEVIAIPSNAPHAAYADAEHVRAVDAWSPVRIDFVQKT